ncbi:2-oxoacid:acceptor oxidoreductase family protein [Archaeoglobus neptunius]|uniref:2-oxoacid:acceptor oxidoreductase family protein n=1 Tax=Archaeoglobus neptunius TaxID=2798580 RepID=UPI00192608F6|nr:2-oxoacid:acceptor oxidoreductase family protein [Archaeoglobus neptunius]
MKLEIRFHGRGGQGAVTASKLLAGVAHLTGLKSQSMPFFGAERRGAPVVAFTRISNENIYETSQVYHPNIVVVLDPLIMRSIDVFSGVKEGGVIVINTTRKPDEFEFEQKFLHIITTDATGIAIEHNLLLAGTPVVSTTVLGAVMRAFEALKVNIGFKVLEKTIRKKFGIENVLAARKAYENAIHAVVKGRKKYSPVKMEKIKVELPISMPSPGVAGRTGFWRDFRPEIEYEKCNMCLNCWFHCPEGAMMVNEKVEIEYEFCKGCLICSAVCPRRAIKSNREVLADAGG